MRTAEGLRLAQEGFKQLGAGMEKYGESKARGQSAREIMAEDEKDWVGGEQGKKQAAAIAVTEGVSKAQDMRAKPEARFKTFQELAVFGMMNGRPDITEAATRMSQAFRATGRGRGGGGSGSGDGSLSVGGDGGFSKKPIDQDTFIIDPSDMDATEVNTMLKNDGVEAKIDFSAVDTAEGRIKGKGFFGEQRSETKRVGVKGWAELEDHIDRLAISNDDKDKAKLNEYTVALDRLKRNAARKALGQGFTALEASDPNAAQAIVDRVRPNGMAVSDPQGGVAIAPFKLTAPPVPAMIIKTGQIPKLKGKSRALTAAPAQKSPATAPSAAPAAPTTVIPISSILKPEGQKNQQKPIRQ